MKSFALILAILTITAPAFASFTYDLSSDDSLQMARILGSIGSYEKKDPENQNISYIHSDIKAEAFQLKCRREYHLSRLVQAQCFISIETDHPTHVSQMPLDQYQGSLYFIRVDDLQVQSQLKMALLPTSQFTSGALLASDTNTPKLYIECGVSRTACQIMVFRGNP